MKIKTEQDPSRSEIEVLVRYAQDSGELQSLLALLRSVNKQVLCQDGSGERLVSAPEIYYVESVEKKTFLYLKKEVLRTQRRLYQLKEDLSDAGFVQISKSCLLNLNFLESIRPLMNSRMEAHLSNGERVLVTRNYLGDIRRALQEDAR